MLNLHEMLRYIDNKIILHFDLTLQNKFNNFF